MTATREGHPTLVSARHAGGGGSGADRAKGPVKKDAASVGLATPLPMPEAIASGTATALSIAISEGPLASACAPANRTGGQSAGLSADRSSGTAMRRAT